MNKEKILKIYNTAFITNVWSLREKALKSNGALHLFFTWRYYKIIDKGNSFIPLSATIKSKPIFPHGINGIFVSSGATIGKNVVIFHQVTIESNTIEDSKGYGSPTIGDNVYIGAGAKIIGNVTVGNNARIGANCVVVSDVPENATVVLQKPRIIVNDKVNNNEFNSYKS